MIPTLATFPDILAKPVSGAVQGPSVPKSDIAPAELIGVIDFSTLLDAPSVDERQPNRAQPKPSGRFEVAPTSIGGGKEVEPTPLVAPSDSPRGNILPATGNTMPSEPSVRVAKPRFDQTPEHEISARIALPDAGLRSAPSAEKPTPTGPIPTIPTQTANAILKPIAHDGEAPQGQTGSQAVPLQRPTPAPEAGPETERSTAEIRLDKARVKFGSFEKGAEPAETLQSAPRRQSPTVEIDPLKGNAPLDGPAEGSQPETPLKAGEAAMPTRLVESGLAKIEKRTPNLAPLLAMPAKNEAKAPTKDVPMRVANFVTSKTNDPAVNAPVQESRKTAPPSEMTLRPPLQNPSQSQAPLPDLAKETSSAAQSSSPVTQQAAPQTASAQAPIPQPSTAPTPTAPAPIIESRIGTQIEAAVERLSEVRETARASRPELTLRHQEFGPVSIRLEAAGSDLRAILANRDPGFAPAIHAALSERAVFAVQDGAAANPQRGHDQSSAQNSHANANSSGNSPSAGAGMGGHSEGRYGSSPGSSQGSSQPYRDQTGRDDNDRTDQARSDAGQFNSFGPRENDLFA